MAHTLYGKYFKNPYLQICISSFFIIILTLTIDSTDYLGATFDVIIGPFIGLPACFSAGLGLIPLFCGVTNCPITSFILSTELFGGGGIYFMLIIATSYMLSGYSGLYTKQKMMN